MSESGKKTEVVFDPCIGVCSISKNGICEGCCRSKQEIDDWDKLNNEEKKKVLENVRKREDDLF